MSFRKAVAAAAAVAMIAMPAVAQAANTASASRLSVSAAASKIAPGTRAGATRTASSKAAPGSTVLLVLAGLAVAAGIYVAVDGGDSASN